MKFLTIFVFAFVVLVSVSAAPAPDPKVQDWIDKIKNYFEKHKIAEKLQEYLRKVLHSPAVRMGEEQLLKCIPDTLKKVIKPPGWQCCNGHVLCNSCRSRSEKCPVCRVPLGPRGRCLLSDKLFTLLADSFPCDGVRSNKNSPKDRRKCSTEFHNQPKMAIVPKQQDDNAKAKNFKKTEQDFILRMGGRRRTKSKKEDADDGQQQQQHQHHDQYHSHSLQGVLNAVVQIKSDNNDSSGNKSSPDNSSAKVTATSKKVDSNSTTISSAESATTTLANDELLDAHNGLQCHCKMCYKPTKEVAIVNSAMATNKYIFRIQAEQQHPHHPVFLQNMGKYQNYQCPTGKLCCCLQREDNVTPSHAQTVSNRLQQQMTNSNLSTNGSSSSYKTLQNEWEILAHLTQDHQLAVNQYYAEFGQRIAINQNVLQGKNVICLNIRGRGQLPPNITQIEKFFVAFVPMSEEQSQQHQQPQQTAASVSCPTSATKVAVFIWHMNALSGGGLDSHSSSAGATISPGDANAAGDKDEVSNFDAIIENPKTGIKWFGRAHCLTTPWSQIHHEQHFLMHEVMEGGPTTDTPPPTDVDADADAFVIVIKAKS